MQNSFFQISKTQYLDLLDGLLDVAHIAMRKFAENQEIRHIFHSKWEIPVL